MRKTDWPEARLKRLITAADAGVSHADLATRFGVTRAAIWYMLDAQRRKGVAAARKDGGKKARGHGGK